MSQKPKLPARVDLPDLHDEQATVMDRQVERVQPPRMYRVILLNDDYTPMEFVVQIIQDVFHRDREAATRIMLKSKESWGRSTTRHL